MPHCHHHHKAGLLAAKATSHLHMDRLDRIEAFMGYSLGTAEGALHVEILPYTVSERAVQNLEIRSVYRAVYPSP